jgi:hypothetical protein
MRWRARLRVPRAGNSWLRPTSTMLMSSSSRLKESTGRLTAPNRSRGSASWPSATARSRMASDSVPSWRSTASRSRAMRSASASVSAAAPGVTPASAAASTSAATVRVRREHGWMSGRDLRAGWDTSMTSLPSKGTGTIADGRDRAVYSMKRQ